MTTYKTFNTIGDIEYMYQEKMGGGHAIIEVFVDASIKRLKNYIKKRK